MASPFDRLMNTIRPHLPGAIDDAIKQELFLTCDEFFNRSNAWRETIDVTQRADKDTAGFMPFSGRVKRLMAVQDDGRVVRGVHISGPETLKFRNKVSADTTYQATFALTVNDPLSRDAFPVVPWHLVESYQDVLISGILARMMSQMNKPYTNLPLATFHLSRFKGGASRARNEANEGETYGSSNWRFPRNFA